MILLIAAGFCPFARAQQAATEGAAPYNIILIGWDGAQRGHLLEMLEKGELPHLAALRREGRLIPTSVTTGKTQTKPGWSEILTGYSAVKLGIISNRDYQPIPSGYTIFDRIENHWGAENVATMFIGGKINNIGNQGPHEICLNCEARDAGTRAKTGWWKKDDVSTRVKTSDGEPQRWGPREGEPYFHTAQGVDHYLTGLGPAEKVGEAVLADLQAYQDRRFFAFFHFEEPDEQGHIYGENSPEYSEALKTTDQWLGRIMDKLRELGIYEKTLIMVTSDHGMDENGNEHRRAPRMVLVTNSHRSLRDEGDRKDVAPTILDAWGIDWNSCVPPLDGQSLFTDGSSGGMSVSETMGSPLPAPRQPREAQAGFSPAH
jgi:hypothetical protein